MQSVKHSCSPAFDVHIHCTYMYAIHVCTYVSTNSVYSIYNVEDTWIKSN